ASRPRGHRRAPRRRPRPAVAAPGVHGMTSYLLVDHVSKTFPPAEGRGDGLDVFDDVTLEIARGEFVTMIGHSGCGKSTLLNIIAGLERPTRGGVVLEGREVTRPGMDRMVVFQNFSLMPWMTAFDNIRLAVRAAHPGWAPAEVAAPGQRWVETVGVGGAWSKRRSARVTRGPQPKLAEQVEVELARPRRRADLIDDPEFLRLRTHILRFLVEGSLTLT